MNGLSKKLLIILFLITCLYLTRAAENTAQFKGIETGNYNGWENSILLEAPEAEVELIIVPVVGGRIIRYEVYGENLFYENRNAYGLTLKPDGAPFFVGGYQCDLGPELRDEPASNELWLGKWDAKPLRDYTVRLASKPDTRNGVQLEKDMILDPETGELGLIQRVKNISQKELEFSLWDRTVCKGGGFIIIPLAKSSKFNAGWSLRHRIDGKYIYDGINPKHPNVQTYGKMLVAQADGNPVKIGTDSDAGWIAYVIGSVMYVKYFLYEPRGDYGETGNTVVAYWDSRIVELGPVSPKKTLKPNEQYEFPEKWIIVHLKEAVTDFKKAKSAAAKVPPSPFESKR